MFRPTHDMFRVALLLLGVSTAGARAEELRREWPHTGNGSVTIDNDAGSVEVIGWDARRVQLRGTLAARAELAVVKASNSRLQLAVVFEEGASRKDRGSSRLVLYVPRTVALTVTGVSADIQVEGLHGSPMVAASTVSGDLRADLGARVVRLKSVSGDLSMTGSSPRAALATVSGDVHLENFAGGADISGVSGDVRIANAALGLLDLESVSGDVEISATPMPDARWKMESLGGDIELRNLDLNQVALQAGTFSGAVETDIQSASGGRTAGRHGKRLRLSPPGATARVYVETFSGDIRVIGQPRH